MKLSVIIPAFNEEKELAPCLASVRLAVLEVSPELEVEVIVVDNNCTDRTAEIGREGGAQVVFEPVRQISRARNAGARAATGSWLLFIDADSRLSPETFAELCGLLHGLGFEVA